MTIQDSDSSGVDAAFARLSALVESRRSRQAGRKGGLSDLRKRLTRYEEQLARQKALSGALLRSVVDVPRVTPPPMQYELALTGHSNTQAAGRFDLVNDSGAPILARFVVGVCSDGRPPPRVTFEPAEPELGRGQRVRVRITVDLSGIEKSTQMEFPIEVTLGGTASELVWVMVHVR